MFNLWGFIVCACVIVFYLKKDRKFLDKKTKLLCQSFFSLLCTIKTGRVTVFVFL